MINIKSYDVGYNSLEIYKIYVDKLRDFAASGKTETDHSDLNGKLKFLLCGERYSLRGDYLILVINAPEEYMIQDNWMHDNIRCLTDIEWKAIFDFDCAGHIVQFFENEGKVVKRTMPDEFDPTSEFNRCHPGQYQQLVDDIRHSAKQPSWIFANGNRTQPKYSPLEWNKSTARSFTKAVQFFMDECPYDRANVVFLLFSADIDVLLCAAREFIINFQNQWMCVVQDEDIGKNWICNLKDQQHLIDSDEKMVVGMPWSHVNDTLLKLQESHERKECEIPTSTGAKVKLDYKTINHLPGIEVLGCNDCDAELHRYDEEQKEELEKDKEKKFYEGEPPTWWNFWFPNQVCEREIHSKLRDIVEKALRPSSAHDFVDRVRIHHQPGAGGTTLAKHILWFFRQTYRVGVIENCSKLNSEQIQNLGSQIMDFHGYKENERAKAKPVLLFLDNPEEETRSLLMREIRERAKSMISRGDKNQVVCVFLECLRLTEISTSDSATAKPQHYDRNCVYLKHELSPREIRWFENKGKALQDNYAADASNVNPDSLISFNILKSNFSKEFISNTVGALVKAITNEKERTLLKYISLLNAFDLQYRAVPLAAFDEMMTPTDYRRGQKKATHWENKLSDAFHVLVYETLEPSIGTRALCSKNSLLAKESLEAFRRASNGIDTVSDAALEFLKCSVFGANCKSRDKLLDVVKDVLRKRESLPNDVHIGEFSPLILHIYENESSDKACDVLQKGYELTEDPFVAQQLARLFIILQKWDQASEAIHSAIDQLPNNSCLWDTCGRIYEKQLSSECDDKKSFRLDQVTEVVDLAQKGIDMFQKSQSANEKEKKTNDAGYYGELDIICTLMDCLMCCDKFQNKAEADLKKLLLRKTAVPADLYFLTNVSDCDYIQKMRNLKPRVDTILKRLEDAKLQLKLSAKCLSPPSDNLVKLRERLHYYFGEDTDELTSK